jgi:hypothetical protein
MRARLPKISVPFERQKTVYYWQNWTAMAAIS